MKKGSDNRTMTPRNACTLSMPGVRCVFSPKLNCRLNCSDYRCPQREQRDKRDTQLYVRIGYEAEATKDRM